MFSHNSDIIKDRSIGFHALAYTILQRFQWYAQFKTMLDKGFPGCDENSQKDLSSVMRKRISGFGSLGVSGDDLLKEIKNERARELYLEGFRLSDLKRWHDPIKRQKQLYSLQGPYNNEMEVKYTDAKYRFTTWPIPKHEIEATSGLVVGNASNN